MPGATLSVLGDCPLERRVGLTRPMNVGTGGVQGGKELLRPFDLSDRAARHDKKTVRLKIGFVLKHAVPGYAGAV